MKAFCAWVAFIFLTVLTAVNLFVPYALMVLAAAVGLSVFLGVPCGWLTRGRKGECRPGFC